MNYRTRRWKYTDAEALHQSLNNIHVWEKICDDVPFPFTKRDATSFIKRTTTEEERFDAYAIEVDNEICGGVYFTQANPPHTIIYKFNFWMAPDFRNSTDFAEVVKDIVRHTFMHLPVIKMICKVHSNDTQAEEMLVQAGFKKEATIHKSVLKSGDIMDMHIYSCCEDMANCF